MSLAVAQEQVCGVDSTQSVKQPPTARPHLKLTKSVPSTETFRFVTNGRLDNLPVEMEGVPE